MFHRGSQTRSGKAGRGRGMARRQPGLAQQETVQVFRALDRSKEKRWSGGYQGPGKPLQAQEGDPCQREENQFY